jgi:predicted FMN-binding regulatory protein PaiB
MIFQGPQAYITPNWYPSKAEHGKVVPTWNYVALHAYAHPEAIYCFLETDRPMHADIERISQMIQQQGFGLA